jgi:SET domain-containing protein
MKSSASPVPTAPSSSLESPWRLRIDRSRIDSQGVFACEPIPEGAYVVAFRGRVIGPDEITDEKMRVIQIGPDTYLAEDGVHLHVDDLINHACEPNLGFVKGAVELYALRDIAAGEELVFDYSTCMNEPGWTIPCQCGASSCRGQIVSFCDLPPSERARLLPIALDYLRTSPS